RRSSDLLINILFLLFSNLAVRRYSFFGNQIINIFQIVFDLLLGVIVLALYPNISPFLGLIFIIPVIEAILLFSSFFALVVAVVVGALLVLLSYLPASELKLLGGIFTVTVFGINEVETIYTYTSAGIILGFTIFWSYFIDIVRVKQVSIGLGKKMVENSETKTQNTNQTEWLRSYNKKIEETTRTLRAKEIELTLAKEQLANLENAKSEFISVTTHELRTPLSAIKWTFNMIMSEQLGPVNTEQKEFLDKGYQSTLKMISIVNNLVHIDHATTKKEDYNFVPTDLGNLVEGVIAEFTNQAISKKIDLNFVKPGKAWAQADVDQNKIRMMLENLVDNAIKYTPKSGRITVSLADSRLNSAQPAVEIAVADTGVGIPKEEQPKIFHKFFRASNARLAEPDGSGIGLYIAKDIIDRHHGSMWFNSEEGKGTTFHIVLPLHQAKEDVL
ncbi:MAG: Histidine kinase protein, partial [Patescibacteria group bacterium]|nr:Histidine kinase protein [Patescibacteria group bacterium]